MEGKIEKKLIEEVQVGSDVEFFLQDRSTGEIVSAEGLVKGSKDDPFKFDENNDWFMTSLDNVAYEGNIPPARTADEFIAHFKKLRNYMEASIPRTLKTLAKGSARLDWKYLETDNAKLYGCSPSQNAWTEMTEFVVANPKSNLRGTGLHIHIGYKEPDYDKNLMLIKAMDLFHSIPAVIIEPEDERKKVGYGKAGNHRQCRYGTEYRSLSSYFASSDELLRWCFNQTQKAIDFINNGRIEEINPLGEEIQYTINRNSKRRAAKLIKQFGLELV